MKATLLAGVSASLLMLGVGSASAQSYAGLGFGCDFTTSSSCPSAANGPGWIITLNKGGTGTIAPVAGQSTTYDGFSFNGGDDTYLGILNLSGQSISSLHLTSSAPIFAFDGDGIDHYGATPNGMDTSGYGGPNAWYTPFSNYDGNVHFITPLGPGADGYFSLEAQLTDATFVVGPGTPEPSTWAMMLLGFGGLGFAAYRSRKRATATAIA